MHKGDEHESIRQYCFANGGEKNKDVCFL